MKVLLHVAAALQLAAARRGPVRGSALAPENSTALWPLYAPEGPSEQDRRCASLRGDWAPGESMSEEGKEAAMLRAVAAWAQSADYKDECFLSGHNKDLADAGPGDDGPMLAVPIERLEEGRPFTLIRYNDGEFFAMRDFEEKEGDWMCANCDGLPCPRRVVGSFKQALQDERVRALAPPHDMRYLVQASLYWDGAFGPKGDLSRFTAGLAPWVDDFVHLAVRDRPQLHERFYAAVNRHKVTLVGPCALRRMCRRVKYDSFIEIPMHHCDPGDASSTVDGLVKVIREAARAEKEPRVFLVSGSMLTNAVGYELLEELKDRHFFVDIGSSLDVFLEPGTEGEGMVPKRVKGERLQGILDRYRKPDEETLKALAGPGKLYASEEAARAALAAWEVGREGGRECYETCRFPEPRCK